MKLRRRHESVGFSSTHAFVCCGDGDNVQLGERGHVLSAGADAADEAHLLAFDCLEAIVEEVVIAFGWLLTHDRFDVFGYCRRRHSTQQRTNRPATASLPGTPDSQNELWMPSRNLLRKSSHIFRVENDATVRVDSQMHLVLQTLWRDWNAFARNTTL